MAKENYSPLKTPIGKILQNNNLMCNAALEANVNVVCNSLTVKQRLQRTNTHHHDRQTSDTSCTKKKKINHHILTKTCVPVGLHIASQNTNCN